MACYNYNIWYNYLIKKIIIKTWLLQLHYISMSVENYKGHSNENRTPAIKCIPRKSWQHCCYVSILPSLGQEACTVKTYRSTQLFLYCSGSEYIVKCVLTALEMETSKEEKRSVVRVLVVEGAGTRHKVKMFRNSVRRNHPFAWQRRPHTSNLVSFRDLAGKHFIILRTAKIFPLVTSAFLAERHSWTSVSFGRGSERVSEVVDPLATYLFLQDWNWSSRLPVE